MAVVSKNKEKRKSWMDDFKDRKQFARKNRRYITDIQKGKFGNIGGTKDDTELSGFMDPAHAKAYYVSAAGGPEGVGPAAFSQLSQLEKEQKELGMPNSDLTSNGIAAGRMHLDISEQKKMIDPSTHNDPKIGNTFEDRRKLLFMIEREKGRLPDAVRRRILNTGSELPKTVTVNGKGMTFDDMQKYGIPEDQQQQQLEQPLPTQEQVTPEMQAQMNQQAIMDEGEGRTGDDGKGFWLDQISTAGGIAGGIAGSFITPVAGTIGGAALGAAAGEMIENIIMGQDLTNNVLKTGAIDGALALPILRLGKVLKPLAKTAKFGSTMSASKGLFTNAAAAAASGKLTGGALRRATFEASGEYAKGTFTSMNRFGPINTKSASLITSLLDKATAGKKYANLVKGWAGLAILNGFLDEESVQNLDYEAERLIQDGFYDDAEELLNMGDEIRDIDLAQVIGWAVPFSGVVKYMKSGGVKSSKTRRRLEAGRRGEFITPKMEATSKYYTEQAIAREQAKGQEIARQIAMR